MEKERAGIAASLTGYQPQRMRGNKEMITEPKSHEDKMERELGDVLEIVKDIQTKLNSLLEEENTEAEPENIEEDKGKENA
jgi:hypothetical protein